MSQIPINLCRQTEWRHPGHTGCSSHRNITVQMHIYVVAVSHRAETMGPLIRQDSLTGIGEGEEEEAMEVGKKGGEMEERTPKLQSFLCLRKH